MKKKFELFFQIFAKNDVFSKSSPDSGFSNPNFGLSISESPMKIFSFFKNPLFFHLFDLKCVEYSIVCRDVRSADFQKPKLGPKRYDKIGHFSYRTR